MAIAVMLACYAAIFWRRGFNEVLDTLTSPLNALVTIACLLPGFGLIKASDKLLGTDTFA